jgi:hypothetical protein
VIVDGARRALSGVPGYHALEYQDADGVRTTMEWRMTRQCVRLIAVVLVVATLMLLFVLMATFFPA